MSENYSVNSTTTRTPAGRIGGSTNANGSATSAGTSGAGGASGSAFTTPMNNRLPLRSSAASMKRDSLAAELERDPQLSSAKRQQRSQVFTSNLAHASLERQLMAAQAHKLELETKLRERELQVERLDRERRWLADREQEEKEEKERERKEHEEDKRRLESELRALRTTLSTLREQHDDLQDTHSSLSRTTSHSLSAQRTHIATLSTQVSLLNDEISQLRQLDDSRSRNLHELQEHYDELLNQSANFTRREEEEESMSVVREELQRQAGYLNKLERENVKLRAEVRVLREKEQSVEVVKEEKRGLERKVRVLEDMREKVVKLEAELDASRREREDWASKAAEATTTSAKVPVTITQQLSELRLSHARLLEEHGANLALLRQRESELKESLAKEDESHKTMLRLEADVKELQGKVERRELRALGAEREVGFLQALVASYTAEEDTKAHFDPTLASTTIGQVANVQRIQQLEQLVSEYKQVNKTLSDELDAIGGSAKTVLGGGKSREELAKNIEQKEKEKEALRKELESTQEEVTTHLAAIDKLEQQLFELSGEVAGGRHVPPGVRVLSLKDNPEQEWFDLRQKTMDKLKEENEALMKRLRDVEERLKDQPSRAAAAPNSSLDQNPNSGSDSDASLVPRASYDLMQSQHTALLSQIEQKEKRLLRLQQVFTSKSQEFREAIASVLGLKLAFYPNGQVRVTSVFDLSASFVFQPGQSAGGADGVKMQLIAQSEGGPQDLPDLMQYWIENEQCIPGFMASVTLECYDKSKREGRLELEQ